MKHAYDRDRASTLVPLLGAIFAEVADRRSAIRELERALVRMTCEGAPPDSLAQATARLAVHRRELRRTAREFERLGCVVDEDAPNRVIIPGANGRLESGFLWQHGESEVQLNAVEAGVL